jgi:hypothetical protein
VRSWIVAAHCVLSGMLIAIVVAPVGAQDKHDLPQQPASRPLTLPTACETALRENVASLAAFAVKFSSRRDNESAEVQGYFVLDHGRFYYRREHVSSDPNHRSWTEERAYDGKVFYLGTIDKNGTPRVFTFLGDNPQGKDSRMSIEQVAYLRAAGFLLPETIPEWTAGAVKSLALQYAQEGRLANVTVGKTHVTLRLDIPDQAILSAKRTDIDSMIKQLGLRDESTKRQFSDAYQKMRALDPIRRVELTLAADKGYALERRSEYTADRKLIQTTENADFERIGATQLWLPRSCAVRGFVKSTLLYNEFSQQPYDTVEHKLLSFSFEVPSDVSFKLAYPPGSVVFDRSSKAAKESTKGKVIYQVPANGDELRAAAEAVRPGWRRSTVLLTVNAIVLLSLLGIYFGLWRKRKQ